jgi:GNAT superfamily N-acetyltransferase
MLLSGACEVFGVREDSFAVADAEDGLVCVFGRPAPDEIHQALSSLSGRRAVISAPEHRDYVAEVLPDYASVRAILHLPGDEGLCLPEVPESAVRLLEAGEIEESLENIPAETRRELGTAIHRSPVATALFQGEPASFCYAAARTETLWDVAIETVEDSRRRGLAATCVAYMAGLMRALGLTPVWGAEETNPASLALAGKLGFVPVDEFAVFQPPPGR